MIYGYTAEETNAEEDVEVKKLSSTVVPFLAAAPGGSVE
jgi:hypothetical protein